MNTLTALFFFLSSRKRKFSTKHWSTNKTCKCPLTFGNSGSNNERFYGSSHKQGLFEKKGKINPKEPSLNTLPLTFRPDTHCILWETSFKSQLSYKSFSRSKHPDYILHAYMYRSKRLLNNDSTYMDFSYSCKYLSSNKIQCKGILNVLHAGAFEVISFNPCLPLQLLQVSKKCI